MKIKQIIIDILIAGIIIYAFISIPEAWAKNNFSKIYVLLVVHMVLSFLRIWYYIKKARGSNG